jgi:1-acyl-sn-glycerol-3-phosphate acyltransferase
MNAGRGLPAVPTGDAPRARRLVGLLIRLLCRVVLATLRIRVSSRGGVPAAPALLLANHLGWLDILAILARHDCSFVAKQEVRRWPIIGALADAFGVVWVDRHRKRDLLRVIPVLEAALRGGRSVLLFPEGTTGDGQALLPFKSALVEAAVRAQVPVLPLALTGDVSRGDATALCWIGDETLVANLPRLLALRGARLVVHAAPTIGSGPSRKAMTAAARVAIAQRTAGGAIRPAPPAPNRAIGWRTRAWVRLRHTVTSTIAFLFAALIGISMLYAAAPVYRFDAPQRFAGERWYNPYAGGGRPGTRWLRSNFHAHSTAWGGLTNGQQSPAAVAAAYRAMHYDVIAISNYHADPRARPPGTFPVYEHGWNVRKSHHLAIGASEVLWLDLPFGASRHQQQYLLDRLHESSPLVAIAHPDIRGARSAADLAALSGYELLEVLNHYRPAADSLWDAALSSGRAIWLLANDDSHDLTEDGETGSNMTFVQSDRNDPDAVIDALRRGAMYGVRAPRGAATLALRDLSVIGDTLRVTVRGAVTSARLIGDGGRLRARWVRGRRDGPTGASASDTTVQLQLVLQPSDSYLRVVVEGPEQLLYTNPVIRWDGRELPRGAVTIDGPRTALWRAAWILAYAWLAAWLLGRALVAPERPQPRGLPVPR